MRFDRREFLHQGAAGCVALVTPALEAQASNGLTLKPDRLIGEIGREERPAPIAGAEWFVANRDGDGFAYRFPAGTLSKAVCLTCDMLLDGNQMAVFLLSFREGDGGRTFTFRFAGLNQCSFRVRMPLALVDQNRWGIDREGAFLKPRCGGQRVDLKKVDRFTMIVQRKGPRPARWCMTPIVVTDQEAAGISKPLLPKGPLLDEMGQSTLHEWPGKTPTVSEMLGRIRGQWKTASSQKWPDQFSRWGGWKVLRVGEGSGYFRTHHDGKRWWLVDPDGYAFWSAGLDCVRVDTTARYDGLETALSWLPDPEGEFSDAHGTGGGSRGGKSINYLAANMIRAFGAREWRERWARIALAELKRLRFNTVGNWSEWSIARPAKVPYVRPMSFRPKRCRNIYRDFPDVFHPDFAADAADYAAQLRDTADDPAFLGYFLMNEPEWGFSSEVPAAGMLYTSERCETRNELGRFLSNRHGDEKALRTAWKMRVTFAGVTAGGWKEVLTPEAVKDLEAFSVVMVERYFRTLSEACRRADPNHLNLGMRWAGVPPAWAVEGMKVFDVFSINCYRPKLPRTDSKAIHDLVRRPVLVGEWHFGALDVGLPSSGIGHLRSQAERAKAYRVYFEDAAANPLCVGAHWFTMYDESALGRFDGENYNIGFFDVCNRTYEELGEAAISSHERMYEVASGRREPFAEALEYLPNLF